MTPRPRSTGRRHDADGSPVRPYPVRGADDEDGRKRPNLTPRRHVARGSGSHPRHGPSRSRTRLGERSGRVVRAVEAVNPERSPLPRRPHLPGPPPARRAVPTPTPTPWPIRTRFAAATSHQVPPTVGS